MHQAARATREVFLQVFLVVFALHNRVVDARARHIHPSDDVFVLLAQRIPVHRHIGERGFLFRQARCRGNVIVDLRAMPIAIANYAKHAERNRKHNRSNDEDNRPHAALSRTAIFAAAAVLAPAHIRRLRRARRNEPTLLGGPLRRIRTIRVLFVRIHAAHYRRKGAAAQRNSCPVRLFFAKAARGHRLGRMRLPSPRPPHISHASVTCAHRLFVAGFRVPSPHIFPRTVQRRGIAQPEFCSKSVSNVACAPRS